MKTKIFITLLLILFVCYGVSIMVFANERGHVATAREYAEKAGVAKAIDFRLGLWAEPGYLADYGLAEALPKDSQAFESCQAEYSRAIALDASDIGALIGLGWSEFSAGNYAAAEKAFKAALEAYKPSGSAGRIPQGDILAALGAVLFETRRVDEAKARFEEALRDRNISQSAASLGKYGLGVIAYWKGNIDLAQSLLEGALAASPNKSNIKRAYIGLSVCEGRLAEAARLYLEVVEANHPDVLSRDILSGLLLSPWPASAGTKPERNAGEYLQAAIDTEPKLIRARLALADFYLASGNREKAAMVLRDAATVASRPDDSIIESLLAYFEPQAKTGDRAAVPVSSQEPAGANGIRVIVNRGAPYAKDRVVAIAFEGIDARSIKGVWVREPSRQYWRSWYWPVMWLRLPEGDGPKRLDLVIVTRSGNSIPVSTKVILDSMPPKGKVTIEQGNRVTGSRSVTADLWAHDDGTSVEAVSLAEDGQPWGPWERYTFKRPFSIFGPEGERWLYARFKDKAGNVSQAYGDSIILDETPPVIETVFPPTVQAESVTITWFTDENSDSRVEFGTRAREYTKKAEDNDLTTWHIVTLTGLQPGTTYYCRVSSRDLAGNRSEYHEIKFTTRGQKASK